ncbi:hypothetical protein HanRHA438_Chr05g0216801 [Helianthus annuus]|nr:hypothetical protein HanHA300_Chr05g0170021 [Helianthus annuus]KAJ0584064.1 hypothetical protein HanHA89_Chr05g0184151 [Helianthus annuus]KAJ0749729.1 hypothetical protein HanLR1_Chr05g0173521 [Helianthus annuus]KAJ0918344.1 hypothetical protein HanRHA438_Chr05g0216801 [Helianthus annuus]
MEPENKHNIENLSSLTHNIITLPPTSPHSRFLLPVTHNRAHPPLLLDWKAGTGAVSDETGDHRRDPSPPCYRFNDHHHHGSVVVRRRRERD